MEFGQIKKLGSLLSFKSGINTHKSKFGKGIKFINVNDILNNNFITSDKIIGLVEVDKKELNTYKVEYGDILFQGSSETRNDVGSANVFLDHDDRVVFGAFVIRGRPTSKCDSIFLCYLLKTDKVRHQVTSKSGGSTRYNIGQKILGGVDIFLPEIKEQKKDIFFP